MILIILLSVFNRDSDILVFTDTSDVEVGKRSKGTHVCGVHMHMHMHMWHMHMHASACILLPAFMDIRVCFSEIAVRSWTSDWMLKNIT